MYKRIFKRLIDILVSVIALTILSPLLLVVASILFIMNRGKPLFFQNRPGKNGRLLKVVKFKTMNDKRDSNGRLLMDKDRVTPFGNFLRKSSIDELPQLFNVVIGDMSLIGPRPLLFEYIPLYQNNQVRRHEVRPGITGWAQVNGRNTISWTKKFELDVWYVDNISLALDIKIIFLSIKKVFIKEGVEFDKPQEIRRFNGTN